MRSAIKSEQAETDRLNALRIANRRRRIAWDVRDSVKMGFRTAQDLSTKPGHSAEEIKIAVEMNEIFQAADGVYEIMPQWAQIDPDSPSVADFSVKPHHVPDSRKALGCRLCASGIDHLRYLGVSPRTGYRLWTGSAELISVAKSLANWKGLYARSRPNGGRGFWILTIEDDRRIDETDPFADIDFDELINN